MLNNILLYLPSIWNNKIIDNTMMIYLVYCIIFYLNGVQLAMMLFNMNLYV